ncbi:MAG: hypothetical protein AB7R55_01365 [Gemmatimonadales bacterium]
MSARRILAALLLACGAAVPAAPQAPDSLAALAREAYRDAAEAYRAGDFARARQGMVRAASVWPAQPAYLYAAAGLSARVADTAAAAEWLERLAALGFWRDVRAAGDFGPVLGAPAITRAIARLAPNGEPLARSRIAFTIPAPDFFAEGIDVDPSADEWFVTSVRHGSIAKIDRTGAIVEITPPADAPLGALLGVRVDRSRRLLWVSTKMFPMFGRYRSGAPGGSGVAVYDLSKRAWLGRAAVPDDGRPHWLGDLVLTAEGDALLTDSESPVIYRARLSGGRLEIEPWLEHRMFRSLQGAALDETGRTLFVADYSHGLFAVQAGTRAVRHLPTGPGASALGIDGLAWWRGSLIGIQNGGGPPRVIRIRLAADQGSVESVETIDRHLPVASEPTIGTLVGDRLYYVADSHWPLYDDEGKLRSGATLGPTHILELELQP